MHAKAVSALLLVSSIGMTTFAQNVGNGDNGGNVVFDPNPGQGQGGDVPDPAAKFPEIPKDYPENVTIMGDINDFPPIDSVNFGEVDNQNKGDPADQPMDDNPEDYSCTITLEVTVTANTTLPYCDETETGTDATDTENTDTETTDTETETETDTSTDKTKSAAPSHCRSAIYAIAIAAALGAANVALF
ncbi:hypothetical protein GGI20_002461 [Coemansia sp. BCRC 34301]|nr:hypothetical protein GGI20_002461 [Coemansia sp. BCRC 34301]